MGFGQRIEELHKELDVQNQVFAAVAGLSSPTISVWKTRTEKEPDTISLKQMSRIFGLSIDWLLGGNVSVKWSPQILEAQKKMREWARTYAEGGSEQDRLNAAWEEFHRLVPDFPELSWAAYLHWVGVGQKLARGKILASMSDWLACKQGQLMPGNYQISGASSVTGIPESWFYTGDPDDVGIPAVDELSRIWMLMKDNHLDEDDLIRIIKQSKSPR